MSRRVLFFGSYDTGEGYPRVHSLRAGLEHHGIEVVEIHETLLPTKGKRHRALSRPWTWPGLALRLFFGRRRLRKRLANELREKSYDAVIVPYPGWFSVGAARKLYDGPLILDLFLSLADTACRDRSIFRSGGLAERVLRRLDRRACSTADRVLLDTPLHATRIAELTGLEERRFDFVQIGDPNAPDEFPALPDFSKGDKLKALYVGTGVPLHGIDHLLDGCEKFGDVELTFVGGTREQRARAETLDVVTRVEEWLADEELREVIASNHVVFGIFGESEKAGSVIPYKVIHGLAHARVVVTAETAAVLTMLAPGDDCLTTPVGDAEAIARVLTGLRDGPGLVERTAKFGRRRYEKSFSAEAIGYRLLVVLSSIDGEAWPAPKLPSELHGSEVDFATVGATA